MIVNKLLKGKSYARIVEFCITKSSSMSALKSFNDAVVNIPGTMLPQLGGMFIFPEILKNSGNTFQELCLDDFFGKPATATSNGSIYKIFHLKRIWHGLPDLNNNPILF